jgi:Uma2 family endonuclease
VHRQQVGDIVGRAVTACQTRAQPLPDIVREFGDVVVDCGLPDPPAREAARPTVVVEVSSPGTLAIDLTDKIDEYQAHDDIQVIMLVEPDVISVKVYRRDMHGLWNVEKYDDLGQSVDLPEVNSAIRLRDIYDTLEPKARPRLHVVQEPESGPKP